MEVRQPVVAGQFYPAGARVCEAELLECLSERPVNVDLPETIAAGIVPHAGWVFSGSLAAMVFDAVKQRHERVDTFVIFGAAHGYFGAEPALFARGSWVTPMGEIAIDEEFAAEVLRTGTAVSDARAHRTEHSIEVQIPFVQHLFEDAKLVPIVVPPREPAVALGEAVGRIIRDGDKRVVCIGSTDLTHYGPRYGFAPMGAGPQGQKWASEVNDRDFIELARAMDAWGLLAGSAEKCNACGPGAAAATIAAASVLGKTEGLLLAHTNSNNIMRQKMGSTSAESVGYAAMIF